MTRKEKIAVIGGGVVGLMSIVSLKAEGFKPVCFEASDRFGGLWNYREESVDGYASLMPTTVLNHSKEMGAFSDFPPKKEYNNYMRHEEYFQYMTEYYKLHDCERYIRFNSEVINVRKSEDYDITGRLDVTVKDNISGKVSTDIFDGVIVSTGHFSFPKMGNFPGLEKFKGEVIHTHSLKRVEGFSGKKVVVIGTGCSGLDAAENVSSVAKQVYICARSGMFVLNRLGPNGYPIDYTLLRRYATTLLDNLPVDFCSWYFETFYIDKKFDHNLYYVKPKYHVLSKDPILNQAIHNKLITGFVTMKGGVKFFTENGIHFEGDETVTEVDSVIMATGYTFKFPFLEEGLLEINDGRIDLYKCMYPAHLPHSSLVFIGFLNPFGPGFPVGEIQCRWAAHMFAGKGKLPSREVMLQDCIKRHQANEKRYTPSECMTVRVDYVSYQDEIASLLGCMPNIWKYLVKDIPLFLRLVFGPSVPYQYRLEGPHKWDGAREAIMTVDERVLWPLSRENRSGRSALQRLYEYIGTLVPNNILIP